MAFDYLSPPNSKDKIGWISESAATSLQMNSFDGYTCKISPLTP
jgi:hypothetical protein